MDVADILTKYLDRGVDGQEIRQLCRVAVAQRIRDIKLATAQAVVQAKSRDVMDDPDGSDAALQQARNLQKEYREFYAEWLGLVQWPGPDGTVADGQDDGAERPGKSEVRPAGSTGEVAN